MNTNKLVSVVIPSYKRAHTVERAVNSVLNQTYKDIEILVVDDNIKDDDYSIKLKTIVESINDTRVRLVTQPKHINGAEARNAGVRASNGDYIAFLDDDDEWLPSKLEKQLALLQERKDIGGCSVLYNEYTGGKLVHSCPVYTEENLFQKIFRREVAVFTSTVLVKKSCLLEAGLFDVNLKRHQDIQLLLRFTDKFNLGVIPEYLVKLHDDSAINRPNADAIVSVKKDFFESVSDLYSKCSKKERSLINSAHSYEVMFAAIKQKRITMALSYFLKAGFSISGYCLLLKRFRDRKYITEQ